MPGGRSEEHASPAHKYELQLPHAMSDAMCDASSSSSCSIVSADRPARQGTSGLLDSFKGIGPPAEASHDNRSCTRELPFAGQGLQHGSASEVEEMIEAHTIENARQQSQGKVGQLVQSTKFTIGITVLILINATYIGVETDMNSDQDELASSAWFAVECGFTILFTCELGLRFLGLRATFFEDGWNLFDLLLVGISVVDTFLFTVINAVTAQGGENDTLDVVSAMRVARLLRLARIFRLLRFFKDLWLLVAGVIDSIRTLAWAWIMIILILYTFGVLTTRTLGQAYGCRMAAAGDECDKEMDLYFGSVPESMLTLFQMITTEGWADIARMSMNHYGPVCILFILFMSLTTFAIMNVVIAVIVQNTLDHALSQKEDISKKLDKDRNFALGKIHEVFCIADKDASGELTKPEFLDALRDPGVMRLLHEVEIDMRGAETLFDILDYDQSGCLDVTEFIDGCMRARGDAKAKDVLALQCDVWRTQQWVRSEMEAMKDTAVLRFNSLDESISRITQTLGAVGDLRCEESMIESDEDGDQSPAMKGRVGSKKKVRQRLMANGRKPEKRDTV